MFQSHDANLVSGNMTFAKIWGKIYLKYMILSRIQINIMDVYQHCLFVNSL